MGCRGVHAARSSMTTPAAVPRAGWPDLTVARWEDTRATLMLWLQVVGKIRLALEPMINHWWQVPFYVSARGLTTALMPAGPVGLEAEFDFVDHALELRTTEGRFRRVDLEPRTVADFYAATMGAARDVGVEVHIWDRPVELPQVTPFHDDVVHRTYDAPSAHRFWLGLVQMHRVFTVFRGRFIGKVSPVHLFWGAMDLAVTRFSGRTAPPHPGGVPNCADWVQELAYSHEVSSCGYWPGGSTEGSFYSYAYPQPSGFGEWPVALAGAFYDAELGEFLLPYDVVRTADDPDQVLLAFLQSTYEGAARLAHWDRRALEVDPVRTTSRGAPGRG
jgi:Family of unknown function (DUF5996)